MVYATALGAVASFPSRYLTGTDSPDHARRAGFIDRGAPPRLHRYFQQQVKAACFLRGGGEGSQEEIQVECRPTAHSFGFCSRCFVCFLRERYILNSVGVILV